MKKIIFLLSLFFSLSGILLTFFFVFFDPKDLTESLNLLLFIGKPYYYTGFDIYIIKERTSEHSFTSISVSLATLFFYLTFLAGSLVYYFSKYKESKLLLFNYALIFFSIIIKIITFAFVFDSIRVFEIVYILIAIAYIFISYYFITKYLNPDITAIENLESASKSKRFLNLLIDFLIIISVTVGFISYAEVNEHLHLFLNYLRRVFGDDFGIYIFFSFVKFIYYLLFESIFKSTPAKFITSCCITDEEGNPPSFLMILVRTLLRFVPFESFTFLMGRNFHDNYSQTYVVNQRTDHKIENRYYLFLAVAFGVLLAVYIYMYDSDTNLMFR